jgi:ATP-binding protein involved in chromosome partitioning
MPDGSKLELFGSGGGQAVADSLAESTGTKVGLLGQVPIEVAVREGGDSGDPIVLTHPESAAAKAFGAIADTLAGRQHSLVGRSLGLSPAGR